MTSARGIGARVLVCEDDAIVASDLRLTLEGLGYEVPSVVHTGADAVESARLEDVDLVLMDVRLPGPMDGIEAAGLVAREARVPVVFLSAYSDDRTLGRARVAGSYGYLVKPYDTRELKGAIEIALYRHHLDTALRASEARFRRLFATSRAANLVLSSDGTVNAVNEAAARLLGAGSPRLLVGRPLSDHLSPARLERWLAVEPEDEGLDVDVEMKTVDGSRANAVGSVVAYRTDGGDKEVHAYLLDVTETWRLKGELHRARKMEAIGRLAGGVSHDFNNLLTGVGGYLDLALEHPALPPSARADLEEARTGVNRAAAVVAQLLMVSRRHMSSPRPVDLNAAVREMLELLARLLPDHVVVETDLDPGAGYVRIDPTHLDQVILNLTLNARDAMPGGGTLTFRSARMRVPGGDDPEGSDEPREGDYGVLVVEDTGTGMEPEVLERLFEPFFTTKDDGSGLGLATVNGILEALGGRVEVESEPGRGARFRVLLPAADAAADADADGDPDPAAAPGNG